MTPWDISFENYSNRRPIRRYPSLFVMSDRPQAHSKPDPGERIGLVYAIIMGLDC